MPGATRTISLDRLEAELDADNDLVEGVDVKNDPPKVIIASKPSLQVLIDGMPQMHEVLGTKLLRVINTRSIILYEADKQIYFLRVQDWWLQAKKLEATWEYVKKLPDDMKKAEEYIVSQNQVQNPEGKQFKEQPSLKETGKRAEIPVMYVVFEPAELIETKSEPKYSLIPGTGLEYVIDASGNIFRSGAEYYILISGRWFKGGDVLRCAASSERNQDLSGDSSVAARICCRTAGKRAVRIGDVRILRISLRKARKQSIVWYRWRNLSPREASFKSESRKLTRESVWRKSR